LVWYDFKKIFSTEYFSVEEGSPEQTNEDPYYRISAADSVVSFILDKEDRFVMVRQYRPNLNKFTLESPAGGVDPGESPMDAMRRELVEEVGLTCPLLPLGGVFRLMMNRTSIGDHIFFGMFPKEIDEFVPEDGIEVQYINRSDLLALTLSGEYVQLAGLGLLHLVSGVLTINMWSSPLAEIERAFRMHPAVDWRR